MNKKQKLGKWGEEIAVTYLINKGYRIIDRNFRTPYGEIDIIAFFGDVTIFVEVKTRSSRVFGYPEDALTKRKLKHMLASAEFYAAENELDTWQNDAISIEGIPGITPRMEHFENVTG